MTSEENEQEFEKRVSRSILASTQKAVVGEAGKTGSWRTLRPIIQADKCLCVKSGKPSCFYCWLYCPEGMIKRTIPPEIDYDYCKGCGMCAHECPTKAILMVPEKGEGPDFCAEPIQAPEEP